MVHFRQLPGIALLLLAVSAFANGTPAGALAWLDEVNCHCAHEGATYSASSPATTFLSSASTACRDDCCGQANTCRACACCTILVLGQLLEMPALLLPAPVRLATCHARSHPAPDPRAIFHPPLVIV